MQKLQSPQTKAVDLGAKMNIEIALGKIAKGDRAAFAALYNDQAAPMLRFAIGLLAGDQETAEDVVDEAFMAIWQQAGSFHGEGSAQGWIRRIVRNKAIDWLRKYGKSRTATLPELALLDVQSDEADSPAMAAEKNSEARELRAALDRLSIDHREVIWLCYFEEKPLSEIAHIVGCPENTVKTRLFNARKQMRAQLIV